MISPTNAIRLLVIAAALIAAFVAVTWRARSDNAATAPVLNTATPRIELSEPVERTYAVPLGRNVRLSVTLGDTTLMMARLGSDDEMLMFDARKVPVSLLSRDLAPQVTAAINEICRRDEALLKERAGAH